MKKKIWGKGVTAVLNHARDLVAAIPTPLLDRYVEEMSRPTKKKRKKRK